MVPDVPDGGDFAVPVERYEDTGRDGRPKKARK